MSWVSAILIVIYFFRMALLKCCNMIAVPETSRQCLFYWPWLTLLEKSSPRGWGRPARGSPSRKRMLMSFRGIFKRSDAKILAHFRTLEEASTTQQNGNFSLGGGLPSQNSSGKILPSRRCRLTLIITRAQSWCHILDLKYKFPWLFGSFGSTSYVVRRSLDLYWQCTKC